MNANEPQNPDQSETTPIHEVADNPAAGNPGQPADAEQQQRGTKRPLLIGACAAVAALLIGGGGVALGAALGAGDEIEVETGETELLVLPLSGAAHVTILGAT